MLFFTFSHILSNMEDKQTIAQPDALERVVFQVPATFKLAMDLEIARRRSTVRQEGTAALAQYLGIPLPGEPAAPAA